MNTCLSKPVCFTGLNGACGVLVCRKHGPYMVKKTCQLLE